MSDTTTPKRNEAVAVDRYHLTAAYGCAVMEEHPNGDYVLYTDYVSDLSALQGEVSRLREAATVLRNNFRCVLSVNCNCDEEFIDRQTAEIDALLEPPTDGR